MRWLTTICNPMPFFGLHRQQHIHAHTHTQGAYIYSIYLFLTIGLGKAEGCKCGCRHICIHTWSYVYIKTRERCQEEDECGECTHVWSCVYIDSRERCQVTYSLLYSLETEYLSEPRARISASNTQNPPASNVHSTRVQACTTMSCFLHGC